MVQGLIYEPNPKQLTWSIQDWICTFGIKAGVEELFKKKISDLILIQKQNASKTLKFWLWQNLIARVQEVAKARIAQFK
jgi:hypothetical protein